MISKRQEEEADKPFKQLFYDGIFKLSAGIISFVFVVLWWSITHQIYSLESSIQKLTESTDKVRGDLDKYNTERQLVEVQIGINTKRLDKIEDELPSIESKLSDLKYSFMGNGKK